MWQLAPIGAENHARLFVALSFQYCFYDKGKVFLPYGHAYHLLSDIAVPTQRRKTHLLWKITVCRQGT